MAYKDKDRQREAGRCTYNSIGGFVYVIHCIGFPYYKIGKSLNPGGRVDAFQIGVPFDLILEYAVAVKDMNEVEYKVQRCFQDKLVRGEWYKLTDEELDDVKTMIVALKACVYTGESYPAYLRKHPKTAEQCGYKG